MSNVYPVCLSGSVVKLDEVDICGHRLTHKLESLSFGPVRIAAASKRVKDQLDKYLDAKVVVSVCGVMITGPICDFLLAFQVYIHDLAQAGNDYRVVALTESLPSFQDCRLVPAHLPIFTIYTSVFGPASKEACEQWVSENCGR